MTPEQFSQAVNNKDVNYIQPPVPQPTQDIPPDPSNEYQPVIESIRRPRKHLTTAPTFIPKTFIDQIQFYDDGTNRRIYYYVNKVWRYSTLT